MRTILWKELHENAKWALIGLLATVAAFGFVIIQLDWGDGPLEDEFQFITVFGSGFTAAFLGFLQTLSERFRDRWSFLLHRPITRTQLFCGKVLSGIILYIVIIGLPFLGAILWFRLPGHFAAPFQWRMALPGLADLLIGFTFYFAAMLTALCNSRWLWSRVLSMGAAGLAVAGVFAVFKFSHAFVVIVIAWAILGAAAWGAFIRGGDYARQPRVSKAAVTVVLLIGFGIIGGFVLAGLTLLFTPMENSWSQHFIDLKGNILQAHYSQRQMRITDMKGNPVEEFASQERANNYYSHSLQMCSVRDTTFFSDYYRRTSAFHFRMRQDTNEAWYYLRDQALFVGYRLKDKHRIGWLGVNGFNPQRDKAQPFPGKVHQLAYWVNDSLVPTTFGVFRIDWTDRTVRKLFSSDADNSIEGACDLHAKDGNGRSVLAGIAIATSKLLILVDSEGKKLFSTPYHYSSPEYRYLQVGALWPGDRFLIWYPAWGMKRPLQEPTHLVELSREGQEISRRDFPMFKMTEILPSWHEGLIAGSVPLALYLMLMTFFSFLRWMGSSLVMLRTESIWDTLTQSPIFTVTAVTSWTLLTGLAIVACIWLTRRYAFNRRARWLWIIIAILCGPIGFLTLLFLHEWPPFALCPTCNKRRCVDRRHCQHCGSTFPPQNVRPGDIFDAQSPQGPNEPAHPAPQSIGIAISRS